MADPRSTLTVGGPVARDTVPHSQADLMAEAYRRGILPPDKTAAFEEAARRGLVKVDGQTRAFIDARRQVVHDRNQPIGGIFDPGFWGKKQIGPSAPDAARASHRLADTMMFGLGDEIDGAAAAAKTGFLNVLGRGPGYSAGDAYEATRRAELEDQAAFAKRHPVANTAATLTGAFSGPGVVKAGQWIARGAGLGAKTVRSGAAGAALGAASGAGNADSGLRNRARGAAAGAAIGGATGAAIPAVAAGGRALVRGGAAVVRGGRSIVGDAVGGVRARLPNAPDASEAIPTPRELQIAQRRVLQQAQQAGRSPQDLAAATAAARGKPITTAEALGRSGVTAAGAVGRRAGMTPEAMEAQLRERAQQAPQRILEDFSQVTGISPDAAQGNIEALVKAGQTRAAPLFDAALNKPGAVWSPQLQAIAGRPAVKAAMREAHASLLNAGRDPQTAGLKIDPDTGAVAFGQHLPDVVENQPTAEGWDLTRKMLGGLVQRDEGGRVITTGKVGLENRNLATAASDLSKALREHIPGYGDALDAGGDYLSAQSAFQRGQKFLMSPKTTARQFGQHVDGLTPTELEAFKGGIASDLFERAQRGRLPPRMLLTRDAQDKLRTIMGEQAPEFAGRLETEARMALHGGRMTPGAGSPTFEFADAAAGDDAAMSGALRSMRSPTAFVTEAAKRGLGYAGTMGTTAGERNALGRIYMQTPEETAAELQLLNERVTGSRAPRQYLIAPAASAYAGGRRN